MHRPSWFRRVRRGVLAATLLTSTAVAVTGSTPAAAAPLVVQDLTGPLTPEDLVAALVGGGVSTSNVTYTGSDLGGGTFSGGAGVVGFDSGLVLASGRVRTPASGDVSCFNGKGVEGPNQCDGNTTLLEQPGDADLTALSGVPTFDATVLEFDFVPTQDNIQFRYVFSSEEYREFANSEFNDTFAFLVNGQNCALVPGTGEPVSINTINNGNPSGDPTPHNPHLFVDNTDGHLDTEMDGLTVVLTCTASVNPGAPNHMKLAIADGSDESLDSAVFLQAGSLVSVADVTTVLSGGGQSGPSITVPFGIPVTDQAFLHGSGATTATGTVTYTVFADPECQASLLHAGTVPVLNGVAHPSPPVVLPPGVYYWVARYSGDANHAPAASACGDEILTVVPDHEPLDTTLTYTGETTEQAGDSIELSGHLVDETGAPVVGVPVTFAIVGDGSCTDDTDAAGNAACSVAGLPAGTYTVHSTFAGNAQYNPSSDTDTLTVTSPTGTGRAVAVAGVLPILGPVAISDTGPVANTGDSLTRKYLAWLPGPLLNVAAADSIVHTRPGGALGASDVGAATIGIPGLPVIRAWGVASWSATTCQGSGGTSSIALLQIGSQRVNVNVSPNTKIRLGLFTIVINEQVPFTTADGGRGLTVNAVHIMGPGLNVVVASATSDIHGCPTPAGTVPGTAKVF